MHDESPTADQSTAPAARRPADLYTAADFYHPGDTIARYTIRQTLGEGGFGVVYQAEQTAPIKRMVALKVIKPGMDSKAVVARFEAERQALALMDHPGVAKVFDGGVTETGRPYFAMELVKGVPITTHCDQQKLSINDRIKLFQQVCNAVQHAHSKAIIHRDLKPSNILVAYEDGKSMPKVIDFGVSKALNQRLTEATIFTDQGAFIGTPEYMSPEQAEMSAQDVDTRSDIYALGVILYELLTGVRPFEPGTLRKAGLAEIHRIIREIDPPKPSTRLGSMAASKDSPNSATDAAKTRRTELRSLTGVLKRDLDWVVMKCLEKDRERRYETANALSMELERYLTSEPVLAGPPSASYRLSKFVKRNRTGVIAAAVVASALLLGFAGTVFGLLEAQRQQRIAESAAASESAQRAIAVEEADRARAERERAEAAEADAEARADELQLVADFQSEQLGAIDVPQMGTNLRQSLIDGAAVDQRDALGEALAGINFTNIALDTLEDNIFERTIEAIDTQFVDQPLVQAQLLQSAAIVLKDLGLLDRATDPQERALETRREQLGDEHQDTLSSIASTAQLLEIQGKLSEAEPYCREALLGRRRVLGHDHPETLESINNIGFLLRVQGKLAEAERYSREALESSRRVRGDDHPGTLTNISNLSLVLEEQGKLTEAEDLLREALDSRRLVLGNEHEDTLVSINNMGLLLRSQGRLAEAEPFFREGLAVSRHVRGDEHSETLILIHNYALLFSDQGDLAQAEILFTESAAGARSTLAETNYFRLATTGELGGVRAQLGRFADAEPLLHESHTGLESTLGEQNYRTTKVVGYLIDLYTAWHEADPTAGHDTKAAEWQAKLPPEPESQPELPPTPDAPTN